MRCERWHHRLCTTYDRLETLWSFAMRRSLTNLTGRLLAGTALGTALAFPPAPVAAEPTAPLRAGGRLDLAIAGFVKFYALTGDQRQRQGGKQSSFDFRNDTEVHFRIQGRDPTSGIVYGAVIELEADTNKNPNADETYVFLRGSFGDLQFGDDDGIAKDFAIGAHKIAVATGGLDGEGGIENKDTIYLRAADNDSTKIKYKSPMLAGFQLGLGYLPSPASEGDDLAVTDAGNLKNVVDGALQWTGSVGELALQVAVVGAIGGADSGGDTYKGLYAGGKLGAFGLSLAGGLGREDSPLTGDRRFANLGAATTLGPLAVSVNYGTCWDCDPGEPEALILGADLAVLPGVALGGEVSFFDQGRPGDDRDDGVLSLVSLRLAF